MTHLANPNLYSAILIFVQVNLNFYQVKLKCTLDTPSFYQLNHSRFSLHQSPHLFNLKILQADQRRAAGAPAVRPRHGGHRRRRRRPSRARRTAREAIADGFPVAGGARQGALRVLQLEDLAMVGRNEFSTNRTGTLEMWLGMIDFFIK